MFDRFRKKSKILVGVKADRSDQRLISFLNMFAKKLDVEIHLSHVIDPFVGLSFCPHEYIYDFAAHFGKQEAREGAMAMLADYSGKFSMKTTFNVVPHSRPSEGLIADAVAQNAKLIVCGTNAPVHRFLPSGFSTAVSLMSTAPVPVLAVPESGQTWDWSNVPRVMIADDLRPVSHGAVMVVLELALAFEHLKIIHTHVANQDAVRLKEMAAHVTEAMAVGDIAYNEEFSPKSFVTDVEKKARELMVSRMGDVQMVIKTRNQYQQKVLFGDVRECFAKAVKDADPDLLIFGRHETFHRKPLAIGKMPFFAMLNLHKPVIVAPENPRD